MSNYEKLILNIVQVRKCVSNVDMVSSIMATIGPTLFDNDSYLDALNNLEESNLIIRLIFNAPLSSTGIVYFPGGTQFLFDPAIDIKRSLPKSRPSTV